MLICHSNSAAPAAQPEHREGDEQHGPGALGGADGLDILGVRHKVSDGGRSAMGETAERQGDGGRGRRHDAGRALHHTGQHRELRRREPRSASSQPHHS